MYDEMKTERPTKGVEPSRIIMAIDEAHSLVGRICDKLQPVIAYKSDAKEATPEKIQSTVLSGIEGLNKRLQELLRNIDL